MKLEGTNKDELLQMGLDVHDITIHQSRIQQSLAQQKAHYVSIRDTCRLNNAGILPARFLRSTDETRLEGFVAFVPAAGAASRYFEPLQNLKLALSEGDQEALAKSKQELIDSGALEWPLPLLLTEFLTSEVLPQENTQKDLLAELDLPKALLPCYRGGESFLQKKQSEHLKISGLEAQVFITPLGQATKFADHLEESKPAKSLPTAFMEQGTKLSTLRFLNSGLPYRDPQGKLSLVPAGHGMLVKLFPEIHRKFPRAHSLLIRNIDNVNGSSPEVLEASTLFMQQHLTLLRSIRQIRQALHAETVVEAAGIASELLRLFEHIPDRPMTAWFHELPDPWQPLWSLLIHILHCPLEYATKMRESAGDSKALRRLYDRPFNSLGQVPNSGKDVGGTPIFTDTDNGCVALCLELPHASPIDRQKFLEDPLRATHFNPVFVAAEIPTQHHAYDLEQCPFWILAKKNLLGQPVVYHEIVLYEVLGNSITANLVFPEIPRILFHPHKTLLDGRLTPRSPL